jgi:plastocyanin
MHRTPLLLLLAGGLALASCGGDDEAPTAAAVVGEPADGARTIEVVGDDFTFDPSEITVEAGEDVAIELTSADAVHDFTVAEADFKVAAKRGDTEQLGLRIDDPGAYTYYCSLPGHRDAGMEGTLTVE